MKSLVLATIAFGGLFKFSFRYVALCSCQWSVLLLWQMQCQSCIWRQLALITFVRLECLEAQTTLYWGSICCKKKKNALKETQIGKWYIPLSLWRSPTIQHLQASRVFVLLSRSAGALKDTFVNANESVARPVFNEIPVSSPLSRFYVLPGNAHKTFILDA